MVLELINVPPQNGLEPNLLTKATCHGYSFFVAAWPPTILSLFVCGTPHLHEEDGGGAGAGTGAGGGGAGAGGGCRQAETAVTTKPKRMALTIGIMLNSVMFLSE